MSQLDEKAQISFEDLSEVFCAMAIRSGDLLALDRLADLAPADRAMHTVMVIGKAAQADPVIANLLVKTGAVNVMRAEVMHRRNHS